MLHGYFKRLEDQRNEHLVKANRYTIQKVIWQTKKSDSTIKNFKIFY